MDETRAGTPGVPIASTSAGLAGLVLAGRYRLDRLIGSGGMAQVWEATDSVLGRRVAVKLLHPHLTSDAVYVQRFRQEAIAAAKLNDPGIVGVFDTCSDQGHEAIVMELLDATTLRDLLDERHVLDAETTERIGLRLLDAIEAAHRAGLVHRDIKPSNVLLCSDGRVKIADFGIAKADGQTELTQEGSLIGTASYLSPEQLRGDELDGRSDLYSLGVLLYECVTGRIPFSGDSTAAVALARLHTPPLDPRQVRADVPPHLANVLMVALALEPDDRFATAADFRAALMGGHAVVAGPPVGYEPELDPYDDETSFSRSERSWLLRALLIILVGAALTVAGLLLRETQQPVEPNGTEPSTADIEPSQLPIARVSTFDPQGSGTRGENDAQASNVADGNGSTAWSTEQYDQADFFGEKTGVGVGLVLESRSQVDQVRIASSANGWSGAIYVIDAESTERIDLGELEPAARVDDVQGTVTVDTGGATGRIVLLWITNLGDPSGDRHRVEVTALEASGRPAPG
ncbi:MAG: protein kinase domain-containing protein [Microthrixaceae bacterium]